MIVSEILLFLAFSYVRAVFWAICPWEKKLLSLGICSCLFLDFFSNVCLLLVLVVVNVFFVCFCGFRLSTFFEFCFSFLLFFSYCFTLLASLAFWGFASHCCFFLVGLLFLRLFLVLLLHVLFFSPTPNCSWGCFDLLSLFDWFSFCFLFIVVGYFLWLLFSGKWSFFFLSLMLLLWIVLLFFLVWVHLASLCLCAFC